MAEAVTHHVMGPGCAWLTLEGSHYCMACKTDWVPGLVNDEPMSATLPIPPPARSMQIIDIKGLDPVEYFFDAVLKGRVTFKYERGGSYRIVVDPE